VLRLIPTVIPGLEHLSIVGMHIGQILNGMCGPACMASPPYISAQWFAPEERSRATAVGVQACLFGSAIGFLLMPYVVVQPSDMPTLLWIHAIMSVTALVLVLIYCPATPPSPPSLAAIRDVSLLNVKDNGPSFFDDVKKIMVNSNFLWVVLAGGMGQGVVSAWASVLEQGLSPLGYSQNECGWFGFLFTVAGLPGGMLIAWIADRAAWRRRLKLLTLMPLCMAILLFAWLSLSMPTFWSSTPPFPSSTIIIGIAMGTLGFFLGGSNPLFYEMCAELTYPVPEGTSG
jgi:sugar phosphate permease